MADPYCLAMVICDAVHQDPGTGKFTLLGTFSGFAATEFPVLIRFAVYVAITDGLGPVKLQLRVVDARSDLVGDADSHVLSSFENQLDFGENPLMVFESAMSFQLGLPSEGLYHCELLANGVPLMSRRFVASHIPIPGEPTE